ncbi:MAG: hypothetical protein K1W20_02420 [Lachnospiraceae bacterium]
MEGNGIFPDNWREVVQEKRVILYNTGVSSLLGGRKKRIEKMKWVFQVFKEHPEVVLWWRPHPLEISTLQSMLPELEEEYKQVRRWYQEEKIGILDDSVDLNRAIAISDAYYGTWSSVAELYKAAQKPVLYENNNVYERHKELSFDITDFVVIGRDVWFLSSTMNILFVMSLDTFEVIEIIKIPYGNTLGKYMSYRLAAAGGYLVLIAGCGKWIIRLDLKERRFDKLEAGKYGKSIKFGAYAVYNECIYMLPAFENRVMKYDVAHNRIVCERKLKEQKSGLFIESPVEVSDSCIYMAEAEGNHIYKYDMRSDTYEKIQISGKDIQLFGIRKVKDLFLLVLANRNEILVWNEKENRTWKLEGISEEYHAENRPFCDFVEYNEDIYFFPEQSDMVFRLNTEQMILEKCSEIAEKEQGVEEKYFTRAKAVGNVILAFSYWNNQWVIVNPEDRSADYRKMIVKREILDEIAKYSVIETGENFDGWARVYEEDKDFYALPNYIKDVAHGSMVKQDGKESKSIGETIYEAVLNDTVAG